MTNHNKLIAFGMEDLDVVIYCTSHLKACNFGPNFTTLFFMF
jgi:hypothetical protein